MKKDYVCVARCTKVPRCVLGMENRVDDKFATKYVVKCPRIIGKMAKLVKKHE